jgi:peptidoglycan hydrolase-like protein with peptidoglycan-binding domain
MKSVLHRIFGGIISLVAIATMATFVGAGTAGAATSAPQSSTPATHDFSAAVGWPTVWPGARGERVFAIQYLLQARGYRLGADGRYGPVTTRSVRSFQRSRGLRATGVVAASTWNRLIVTLRRGSSGPAVRGLQHNLRYAYGFLLLRVTGYYGIGTVRAVTFLQAHSHLQVDGVTGYNTWKTIIWFER